MKIEMNSDLPQGTGIVLDALGQEIARIDVPGGKRPEGAHTLVLSVEDFGQFIRAASAAPSD